MSGSWRGWSLLAWAVILTSTGDLWAADKRATPDASDAVAADDSVDEPFLVIPPGPPPSRARSAATASTQSKAAAEGDTSTTFFGAKARRKSTLDSEVVLTSGVDDAPPAAGKGSKSAPSSEVIRDAPEDSFEAPLPFDESNAGYHPARVTRKGGDWFIRGSEPAGPRSSKTNSAGCPRRERCSTTRSPVTSTRSEAVEAASSGRDPPTPPDHRQPWPPQWSRELSRPRQ